MVVTIVVTLFIISEQVIAVPFKSAVTVSDNIAELSGNVMVPS